MNQSRLKRWLFRAIALLLGLLPLLVMELLCGWFGWGEPTLPVDPFVGFRGSRPLFERSADGQRWQIAANRQVFFCPDQFLADKPADEFRVFCLGGSTVQGRPYAIETSFTTWLELSLSAADSRRRFDVINCGGISYASYRLVPILDEVLQHEPDLIIVYTGHNEFLEDRSYGHIKNRPGWLKFAIAQAARLRSYRAASAVWRSIALGSDAPLSHDLLPEEVEARLDYAGGLEQYHRDPVWSAGVAEHFGFNVRSMIARCRQAGVPIWFVDPVCNLRSCPPFKSEHRAGLSDDDRVRWDRLRAEASELFSARRASEAIVRLEMAQKLDGSHAGLCYDLAKSHDMLGHFPRAKEFYTQAKDADVCPLRITEPLREQLRVACRETETLLIDVTGLFEQKSRDGIPGGYLMVDHVHPSITGHQMIAELLVATMQEQSLLAASGDWQAVRDQRYAEHLKSLDDAYFLEAQRRLEGLRKWAQGRAKPRSSVGQGKDGEL